MSKISDNIKAERIKHKMSQEELAGKLYVTRQTVSNYETGKSNPSLDGIIYICDYLGITLCEFFDVDSKNPAKLDAIIKDLKKLDDKQLDTIATLVKGLTK